MAPFSPRLKTWLVLVERGHASEPTWAFYRAGRYTDALSDCKYTLARFANHPGALFLLGEIAKQTQQPYMPIEYFEAALKLYPQRAYTHAQYGRYLIEIGGTSAGIAELREALRLDPNQLQARVWLADAVGMGRNTPAPNDSAKGGPGRTKESAKN